MQVNWQVPGAGHPPCKKAFGPHVSYDVLNRPNDWPKLYPRHSHCDIFMNRRVDKLMK